MTPDEELNLLARVAILSASSMALTTLMRQLVKDRHFNADAMLTRFEDFWMGQNASDDEIKLAKAMLREFLKK